MAGAQLDQLLDMLISTAGLMQQPEQVSFVDSKTRILTQDPNVWGGIDLFDQRIRIKQIAIGVSHITSESEISSEFRLVIDEDDIQALLRSLQGLDHSGRAAADDGLVCVEVDVFVSVAPGCLDDIVVIVQDGMLDLADPGSTANQGLDHFPCSRMGERLVIKTNRHQPVCKPGDGKHIVFKRRAGILMCDDRAVANLFCAGTDICCAVYVHEAVRAFTCRAEQPPWAMVFEAAAENANAGPVERRSYRVSLFCGVWLAVEIEGLHPAGATSLVLGSSSGKKVWNTSFVTVFLTARNHCLQPERWNHHSF